MPSLTFARRLLLAAAGLVAAVLLLFPPWLYHSVSRTLPSVSNSLGFYCVLTPPFDGELARPDVLRLVLLLGSLTCLTGALFVLLRPWRSPPLPPPP